MFAPLLALSMTVQTASAQDVLPYLSAQGVCGGAMTFTGYYLTPGGNVAGITGAAGGSTTIPAGMPCAGTRLAVGGATHRATVQASVNGNVQINTNVPGALCGQNALLLDLTSCLASNAVPLPQGP